MPATYEPIASQTLGADAASVSFSSLSGNYTDLILIVSVRNSTVGNYGLRMRFNSDTGSNYSYTFMAGDGSSASSGRASSQTEMAVGNTSASTGPWAASIIQVMSYANTNVFKTVLNAGLQPDSVVARNVNLWRSTSAVTSISLFSNTGNLLSGSTFSLYGIKAA